MSQAVTFRVICKCTYFCLQRWVAATKLTELLLLDEKSGTDFVTMAAIFVSLAMSITKLANTFSNIILPINLSTLVKNGDLVSWRGYISVNIPYNEGHLHNVAFLIAMYKNYTVY